jgi:hypothetical protein
MEAVESAAMWRALAMHPDFRVVVSDWNLIEVCRESYPVHGWEVLAISTST